MNGLLCFAKRPISDTTVTLSEHIPTLTTELVAALEDGGFHDLAIQVPNLTIVRACCESPQCASFYTSEVTNEVIGKLAKRIIVVVKGLDSVFVIDGKIVFIELRNRPDVRSALDELVERN